ncbi:hypothetical protein [Rhodococcus rhodochrous]|uniref:hypothetical protein n=1 Tax=Rhodococcus rhodochrous TaxID=1829 RepID=UPI0024B8A716|nr:hypothetical protein [Rhodococcus rhodochrous]MDJ0399252.1 hypothetical protein [Rhodococcus rhodochrous]
MTKPSISATSAETHEMSSEIEPPSFGTYPRNDQRPYWPQAFRPVIFLMAVALALSAMVMIPLALRAGKAHHALEVTGYVGGLSMMALLSVTALRESGFRHVRRSSRIHRIHDPRHGDGIIVPMRRGLTAPVMIVLLGGAVYGVAASTLWFIAGNTSLLPEGRDTPRNALLVAVLAAVALLLSSILLAIRIEFAVRIFREGIERHTRRRIFFSDKEFRIFLPWVDITSVDAEMNADLGRHPSIGLRTARPIPEGQRTPHDSDDRIAVLAHALAAEPNTLVRLLQGMKENPEKRPEVERPDSEDLLRPPPLRERFRAARRRKASR